MRKKWISVLIMAAFFVGLMSTVTFAKDIVLRIGGGIMGGPFFPQAAAVMMVSNEAIPGLVSTVIPGNSVKNLKLIDAGKVDIGLTYPVWSYDAWHGKGVFKGKKYRNIRSMGGLLTYPFQLTVPAKSKIRSVRDLRDKRLAVGPKGSGTETHFRRIMDIYGLTWDGVRKAGGKVNFVSFREMSSLMKDRHVDCAIFPALPDARIMEVETSFPCRVLNIDQEHINTMKKKYPGTVFATVPKGTYKGQDSDANTFGFGTFLLAKASLPEDLVYGITKAVYENPKKLAKGWPDLIKLTPQSGLGDVVIHLHAGAAKYYREKGLTIRPDIQPIK
jgi:TRAP transporter TAXI family solute receptor